MLLSSGNSYSAAGIVCSASRVRWTAVYPLLEKKITVVKSKNSTDGNTKVSETIEIMYVRLKTHANPETDLYVSISGHEGFH